MLGQRRGRQGDLSALGVAGVGVGRQEDESVDELIELLYRLT